jgi:DNA-binding ferritin-like protein
MISEKINTLVCSTIDAANGVWLAHVNSDSNNAWYSTHLMFGDLYDYLIGTVKDKAGEFNRQLGNLVISNSQNVTRGTVFEEYPYDLSLNEHLIEVEARLADLLEMVSELATLCSSENLVAGNNLFSGLAEGLSIWRWKIASCIEMA